ncbi:MAG: hypothetical protein GWN67_24065 [Phycisphaerae bacterium]|nr:hypothetical protein [Phycisphaerae bacterium]NIP55271.1 hypothetical protein [Phycisphaerae bacterium]NIS53944.1 hypothetical protein [Phycisphaerae bacterium]NIU11552.1 hypothetical protein [Phycisphaerae bacterium]NIU59344.1 hypothetical protein [Phycisphaerae bacterium]
MAKKKNKLVPYDMVSPGFEGIYTGKKSSSEGESDDAGNEIHRWPVFTWTSPGQEKDWDEEIRHINSMQSKLGDLDDSTRQIRAHIGSLVPCDSGFPVTVDELLNAIGRGKLDEPSFHNGCWCSAMWWEQKTTQPFHIESMRTIHAVLTGYLAGKGKEEFIKRYPHAANFINRTYEWLGSASKLTDVQKLMMERVLLIFDFFSKSSFTAPGSHSPLKESELQDMEALGKDVFYDENGRGPRLDAEISELAGLPKIRPEWDYPPYLEAFDKLKDKQKQELYKTCCAIASGIHTASDCHHNTFRYIEGWIHGIGTGRLGIPTRKAQSEKQRLGHMLFGYVLGLDKWLVGMPMQFLLIDLGHIDLGFDPKNEILRVYAYLGEKKTPVKEWLVACLWYTLTYNPMAGYSAGPDPMAGYPVGLVQHKELLERAEQVGISPREWMDSALGNDS